VTSSCCKFWRLLKVPPTSGAGEGRERKRGGKEGGAGEKKEEEEQWREKEQWREGRWRGVREIAGEGARKSLGGSWLHLSLWFSILWVSDFFIFKWH
jgi:hypothetical protein